MRAPTRLLALACVALGWLALRSFSAPAFQAVEQPEVLSIGSGPYHLGDDHVAEWPAPEPAGFELELVFDAPEHSGPVTLELVQRDVHRAWEVALNGARLGRLPVRTEQRTEYFEVAAGLLRAGPNTLTIVLAERPEGNRDDVLLRDVRLHLQAFRELFRLARVTVLVREQGSARPLPARLTLVAQDEQGRESAREVPIFFPEPATTALRSGIVYVGPGTASFEVPRGDYVLYASRGVEWSRARIGLSVGPEGAAPAPLELERQVDTMGWIAADTHLHTYTFSGHGDSTVEERVVTLAAEGVELAIATDHNHHTDYAPVQAALELNPWFTPVVGNEVTTRNGHFNAFPMPVDGRLPDHTLEDWVALVDDMRAAGASVVILNHPRWPRVDDCPLSIFDFDPRSGERRAGGGAGGGPAFTFDALELVNATCDTPDPLVILRDWFGVLNGGERVFAVGTSDSHTVGDPVGQGRTYVASVRDDPAAIDVDAACATLRRGRMSVSLGLFVTATASDFTDAERSMGETVTWPGLVDGRVRSEGRIKARVQAAHWARPRELVVYANGLEVLRRDVPAPPPGEPTDVLFELAPMLPAHDAYVVCAVVGDPVAEPFWHSLNRYTFAATNPFFYDVDADGTWQSPRAIAQARLAALGAQPDAGQMAALVDGVDAAVAAQLAVLTPLAAAHSAALGRAIAARHSQLVPWIELRRNAAGPAPQPSSVPDGK